MSINIETEFKHANGTLSVHLTDMTAKVVFLKDDNEEIVIEDSFGEIANWEKLYQRDWVGLTGDNLINAEEDYAIKYAKESFDEWSVWVVLTEGSKNQNQEQEMGF